MALSIVIFSILGIFSFIFLIIYWKLIRPQSYYYNIFRNQGISCEPFIPIIGHMPDLRRALMNDALMDYFIENAQKHGYVNMFSFGSSIFLTVIEPDMLADIFGRTHAQDYQKTNEARALLEPLTGVHNLLISEGSEHERARKMLNPAFHFVKLHSMVSIMIDQTHNAIREFLSLETQNQVIDLQAKLSELTLTIIASSAFGKGFETIADAKQIVSRAFIDLVEVTEYRSLRMINQLPLISHLPFWRKNELDKYSRDISNFVDQIIADRRHNRSTSLSSGEDLLDLLLSAVDSEGQLFNDQEIKDEALTFVFAGHETTGNLIAWTMYVLMTNEKVLEACREEVDRIFPNGAELTHEHINGLVVCEGVLQETLRLYPPVPFVSRQCIREHYIGREGQRQIRIPVGAKISVNTYTLHRREEYWPRPNEFDHTRWMRDPITKLKPKLAHPFCYLPFAAGPRNCIGQNFALLEAKVMLAMFIQRCNFELEPGQKIVPDVRVTMRPKYGLRAKVTKRL